MARDDVLGASQAMTCEWIKLPDGTVAIVKLARKRQQRCKCGAVATLQCDYPIGHGTTCDAYLCRKCAVSQGRNRDYCPHHPDQGALSL